MEAVGEGRRKSRVGDGCTSGWKAPGVQCRSSQARVPVVHTYSGSVAISIFDPPLVLPWFSPSVSCDHIGFLPGQMNFWTLLSLVAQHSCPKSSFPSHRFYFILG